MTDLLEQDTDPDTATHQRKRPHDVVSRDDTSNAGSAHLTPRKRAKHAGKLGGQDVSDFVPLGASFSTSVVPVDEAQDSGDDGSQAKVSFEAETLNGGDVFEIFESNGTEQQKALVEGRRLLIRDLPPDTTEEDLTRFFKGYNVENIWLPDRNGDKSQPGTSAQKENLSMNGDSAMTNSTEGDATGSCDDGRRLYVGNVSYKATVEDLRKFFRGFPLKNVTIPINPRTHRSVGYAFVTVSTCGEVDRAISQLSGSEILERRVSIQRARAKEIEAPGSGTPPMEETISVTMNKSMEGDHDNNSVRIAEALEESKTLREVSEPVSSQNVQATPPVTWNAVNTTKIRTSLGGSVGKVRDQLDQPGVTNENRTEVEGKPNRASATSVALERVEALRFRLSSMSSHDGPVSAYDSAQQELHDAEVDYNYCLYFPSDEEFQSPPLSTARKFPPKKTSKSRSYRLRLWNMVERCMKEGTLQDLKDGRIRVYNLERLDQLAPPQVQQIEGQRDLEMSTSTDLKQIQIHETQDTSRKQYGYLSALPNMEPGTHSYEKMKKRIHDTEIHLNYCKYFPVTEDYLPLALAKKGVNESNSSKDHDNRTSEHKAAQIWKLVERSTQDGTLQDLKDGRLDAWIKHVPPPNQSTFASALQARTPQELPGSTGHNSERLNCGGPKEASNGDDGIACAVVRPIPKEGDNMSVRQSTSESERGVILNLDYGDRESPKMGSQNLRTITKSGDEDEDEQVSSDEQEVPSINRVDDDLYASISDTESEDSGMDSEGQSEDGDAMMQYSNSEQLVAEEGEPSKGTVAVPPKPTASVLADLSPYDFNAQLRYFHTTKAREEVDGQTPVRCLVCAKEGHMAGLCDYLTCSTCGAFNRHTTHACPKNAKCGKCREQGHEERYCPYKLKRLAEHEIVCDLCQRNGHIEDDCELVWRTSGRPWESDLMHADIRLSCYECGHSGHLGNACPSRKPNKTMGTSTWDSSMGSMSIKSMREIKIKGKATRQDPINLDDSDDDQANFYRPRIPLPQPVRKGQIRIVTGRHDSPVYEHEPSKDDRPAYADHRHRSFTPINESYGNDKARRPYQDYRDRGRENGRAVDGPDYTTGHNDLRYRDYRPSGRRSRSPPYRDHEGYAGGSSWPPPRPAPRAEPPDRRPRTDADVYRPMPSAAQNAWARRRL